MAVTCDNKLLGVYVNGKRVRVSPSKNVNNWGKTKFVKLFAGAKTVGIHCSDHGVIAGMIASTNNGIVTNGRWKCTSSVPLLKGG